MGVNPMENFKCIEWDFQNLPFYGTEISALITLVEPSYVHLCKNLLLQ